MNYKKKYWTTASLSLIAKFIFAQTIAINPQIANNLLGFEQRIFVAGADSQKYVLLFEKLNFLVVQKQFELANREISRIEKLNNEILVKQQFRYLAAQMCFQNSWYVGCLSLLQNDSTNTHALEKSFLRVMCFNELNLMDDVKHEIREANLFLQKDTIEIFSALKAPTDIKTRRYLILQGLLPGLGMSALGYHKKGVTSLVLNGLFAAIFVESVVNRFYFVGLIYGAFQLSKFYLGGIKHVRYLVEKTNDEHMQKIKHLNSEMLYNFYKN